MELNAGDKAPEFNLPSSEGRNVSLKSLAGKKVVLYFYPKDDTSGCTREACGFRDVMGEFKQAGAEVLGVSADDMDSHHRFIEKHDLNFTLLSDEKAEVSTAYGAWGEKQSQGKTVIGMRRMTFLIDARGNIQRAWPQVTPEGHADEVLEAIKS